MAQNDGKIILSAKVDTKGIKASAKDMENAANKAGQAFGNLGGTLAKALAEGDTKTAQLANNYQKATDEVAKQIEKVDELKLHLAQLKSGEVSVDDNGVLKLQADFDKTSSSIEKTKAEINELYMQLDQLQANAFKAPGTGEIVFTESEKKQFDSMNAKLDELEPKLAKNKEKATELGKALQNAVGTATQAEIDKTKTKLSEAERKLGNLCAKAEIAGQKLETEMNKSQNAVSQVSNGFGRMGTKLLQLAKGALVFSVITKGFTSLRQNITLALMSNESFRQSLYQLQAAFWVAFAPIYNYVLPALKTLINWITAGINAIVKFFAFLTGKSFSAMVENGKKLKQQADAYKSVGGGATKAAKGMKKATDEAKKQIAAFDELNILSEDKASADSSDADVGGVAAGGGSSETVDIFGGLGDPQDYNDKLTAIGLITGWALVGLGIALLFIGNIPLGVGAIIAGAVIVAGQLEKGIQDEDFASKLVTIATILGAAMVGLGIILLFTPAWPFGLGLIIEGVVAIVAAKQLGKFSPDLQKKITDILVLAGEVMLVLGCILLFVPGAEMIGLGLLAAGALLLGFAGVMNAETVKQWITDNMWELIGLIGEFIFCVGVILLFVPGLEAVGLGAMVAGIAILAISELIPNWDFITEKTKNFLEDNKALIVGVGSAMLVLGIILLFTGVGIPLALGLIAAGGLILTGEIAANWNFIVDKIKEVWGKVKSYWKENIAKYFTAKWWGDLAKDAINGFVKFFINGLNKLIEKINSFGFDMPDALGGGHIGFNISTISVPGLARGTVVPQNREFLALLGDNKNEPEIVSPLSTMEQAVENVMSRMGGASQTTVILEVDGREFGRAVVKHGKQENRRVGTNLVFG